MPRETRTESNAQLRIIVFRWAALFLAAGLFAAWSTCRMSAAAKRLSGHVAVAPSSPETAAPPTIWTCPMHAQVRMRAAGECPICGMDLLPLVRDPAPLPLENGDASITHRTASTPLYRCTMPECGDQGSPDPQSRCPVCGMKRERMDAGGTSAAPAEVMLSERARRLAEVRTETAEARLLFTRIRAVGRVGYDETRYKMASAWMDGRIEKLFADYTGMTVQRGDHLVAIYSPQLLSAQEEFLQALHANAPRTDPAESIAQRASAQVLRATRRKLELLGITAAQIDAIERNGEPQAHLVVHAPIGGTIIEKHVMEGMYVETGDTLYTIADLSHLWLLVDLYEDDLPWVKPFQQVRVTTRALPGEVFVGEIVFVDPRVDPRTRTIACRIHVANPVGLLKPDMWVTAVIDAGLAAGGRGVIPAPKGALACPMHPWESADEPGVCAVCDMQRVPIQDLPQYTPPTEPAPILAVPRDAVMQTGERALVYVETRPGHYQGVEVTCGPLAHDERGEPYLPILSGLEGGEHVVSRGNFAIDSQMQLAGKPSLFSARGIVDDAAKTSAATSQTRCPVMGGPIDPEVHADVAGVRIWFCCPPCIDEFKADPTAYLHDLPAPLANALREALIEEEKQ